MSQDAAVSRTPHREGHSLRTFHWLSSQHVDVQPKFIKCCVARRSDKPSLAFRAVDCEFVLNRKGQCNRKGESYIRHPSSIMYLCSLLTFLVNPVQKTVQSHADTQQTPTVTDTESAN